MQKDKFFWNYFKATGNIGAYLIYREIRAEKNMACFGMYTRRWRKKLG